MSAPIFFGASCHAFRTPSSPSGEVAPTAVQSGEANDDLGDAGVDLHDVGADAADHSA